MKFVEIKNENELIRKSIKENCEMKIAYMDCYEIHIFAKCGDTIYTCTINLKNSMLDNSLIEDLVTWIHNFRETDKWSKNIFRWIDKHKNIKSILWWRIQ